MREESIRPTPAFFPPFLIPDVPLMLIVVHKRVKTAVPITGRRSRSTACHLDRVFETRVLFQMMGKGKTSTRMHVVMFAKERDINIRV